MRKTITLAAMLAATTLGAGASTAAAAQTVTIADAGVVTEGTAGVGGVTMPGSPFGNGPLVADFTVATHVDYQEVSEVAYQVTTSAGTALGGQDYVNTSIAVADDRLPPCDKLDGCKQTRTFRVPIVPDDRDEPDETLLAKLSSNAMTVIDDEGRATIADDDGPAVTPVPAPAAGTAGTVSAPPANPNVPPERIQPTGGSTAERPADAGHFGDRRGPRMGMIFRGLRGARAKVRARCPGDEFSCRGRVAIRLNGVTLASAPFRLKGGESRVLAIRLTGRERRRLRRAGVVHLRASAFDRAGNRLVRNLRVQL